MKRGLLLALLLAPVAAQAGDYPFAYRPQTDRYRMVVSTPRSDQAQVRVDGRDVVVQLDRPLKEFDTESAVAKSNGWIESAQAGYDSVLFRSARPIETTVERKPGEIVITFVEAAAPPMETGASDRSELRLKTLEAQLTTREGAYDQAREKYEALRNDLPGDAEPTAGLAEVAEHQGHWREARDLYAEASRQAPLNEEVRDAHDRIESEHRSFVRFEAEWRKTDGGSPDAAGTANDQRYFGTHSTAEVQLTDQWRVGLNFDAARVKAAQVGVLSPDTRTVALNGWARRADAFLRYDDLAGGVGRIELYADGGAKSGQVPSLTSDPFDSFHGAARGGGLEWSEKLSFGRLVGRVEWHRPNWDFTEGLAQGGTRDRVLLSLEEARIRDVTGRAAIGFANYGLKGSSDPVSKPNLARSVVANLDLRTPFDWFGPSWSVGYAYDAEYVLKRKLATFNRPGTTQVAVDSVDPDTGEVTTNFIDVPTTTPEQFAPIPLVNREVHVLTLVYAHEFLDGARFDRSLLLEVAAGPGFDRYGRGGWLANSSISYARGPWRVAVRGGWVAKIGRNGDSVGTLGLSLMRQF
ncbi:tetratricopeptide repeat protein [Roseiterribacter gracilis]|uniref:Uncharacterized protein n=1 Tax=Roseiterribacter gracilis TaxID=2812848 RepID=A0A8S8XIN4_9PROT|nr:hypothetical protein TMPK1_41060 [Rhodospirillales bacterium TMPK1]